MHRVYEESLEKGNKMLAHEGNRYFFSFLFLFLLHYHLSYSFLISFFFRVTKCEPSLKFERLEKKLMYLPVFISSYM